jgi:hypothetical protein
MNKTFTTTRRRWLGPSAASLAALGFDLHADSGWPSKPVNFIVPFFCWRGYRYICQAFVKSEIKKWAVVVKASGAKLD